MKNIILNIIIFLSLFIINNTAKSQFNMNWDWVKTAGGSQSQKATAIAVDNNNDVIIAGTFTSNYITLGTNNVFLSNSDSNSFASNYFIAKYNQSGQVIWAKKESCNIGTSSNKLVTDNNGNIYASGFISNSNSGANIISFDGVSTFSHINGGKSFIVKYSPQGVTQWVIFTNNKYWGNDSITTLKWDKKSASLIIGGSCLGDSVSIGNFSIINSGNNLQSSFIAKVSVQQGNIVWLINTKGGSYASRVNDISIDSSGAIYTAASFSSNLLVLSSNDTLINTNSASGAIFYDGYIAKYNENGILQWVRKGGCASGDEITSIACNNNNHIIAGGYNSSQLSISGYSINSGNFLLEYDLQGNLINLINFPATIKVISAYKTGNGFMIGGTFTQDTLILGNTTMIKYTNPIFNNSNIFVVKCDSFAFYNNAKAAGGQNSSILYNMITSDSNKVYICGSFNQPSIRFDSVQYNSNGISDIFLAKLNTSYSVPFPYKYNIGGTVFAGLLPADFAVAYLYDNHQNIIETCNIDSNSMGFYQFYQKPVGKYKISAELLTNSKYFFQNYISTFYPNKTNFAEADTIFLNMNSWGKDIQLQKSNNITENSTETDEIIIFPNPAKNNIYISIKQQISENCKLEVYNFNGQKLISENIDIKSYNENIYLNISHLSKGLYSIIFSDVKGKHAKSKFMKIE